MDRTAATILPLLWLILLIGALKLIGYLAVVAGNTGVVLLLLVLWAPLAAMLFWRARRRRAVALAACLSDQSGWRRRLRGGLWMGVVQAAAALPLAIVLLAVISQPQAPRFWWWLLLAVPLWWTLWSLAQRLLRHDVNPPFLLHAAGVLAVRTTGALLVLMLLLVSLWTPVADVSSMNLVEALRLGMSEAAGESPLLLAGAKIWHALSWLQLWLVQQIADGSASTLLRLLAWLLLLIQGACFVWPVLLLMHSVSLAHARAVTGGVVGRLLAGGSPAQPRGGRAIPVAAGIAALIAIWSVLAPRPAGWLSGEQQLIQLGGTRYAVPTERLDRILRDNADWLDADLTARVMKLDELANTGLDRLFADVRGRVPAYADWHYSLSGGMTRTVARLMEYFSADNARAVRMLAERLFPPAIWQQKLQAFEQEANDAYAQQLHLVRDATLADLQRRLTGWQAHPHRRIDANALIDLDRPAAGLPESPLRSDVALRQAGVSAALGAGAAAFSLTQSVRTATQARAAQGTVRGAARLGARAAGRGSAAGSASLCAASGPLALGCAVAVFTGVTLASEYAILKADELLSRQQLEADLLASIDGLQKAVTKAYLADMVAALHRDSGQLRTGIVGRLRPIDSLQAPRE